MKMPPGYRLDQPWLPEAMIVWLETVVNENMRVFEWGAGGSTIWLAQRCQHVMSVETEKEWINQVVGRAKHLKISNIKIFHVPVPDDPYYTNVIDLQPQMFDLIFVDGKKRMRCINAAIQKVAKGGYILLDNSDSPAHEDSVERMNKVKWPYVRIESEGVGGHWAATMWRKP